MLRGVNVSHRSRVLGRLDRLDLRGPCRRIAGQRDAFERESALQREQAPAIVERTAARLVHAVCARSIVESAESKQRER